MTDPANREYKGPPRWVKRSTIIVLILVLLFVVHLFIIGGIPGMHFAATPK